MNLTLHIVRKDWARDRSALFFWYALIAGKAWWVWQLGRSAGTGSDLVALGTFADLLNGVEAVLGTLFAARLALEDLPWSPKAFGTTRPLGRGRLVRAKILGASLFLLVGPVLLLVPVWIAAGFTPLGIASAATEWMLVQGCFVALGLLGGTLTRDLGQTFFALPFLGLALLGVATWFRRFPGPPAWLSMALALAVAVVGIVLAHRFRRRGPALGFVGVGFCLIAGGGLPEFSPDESLAVWPDPTLPLQIGEARKAPPQSWRFVGWDYDPEGRPVLRLQHTGSWFLPRSESRSREPGLPSIQANSNPAVALLPRHLGTVQAASLRVSRWHLIPTSELQSFAGEVRLFATPPSPANPNP